MANKMEEVATLLGVELGERFKITGYRGEFYLDSIKGLLNEVPAEVNKQVLYSPDTLKMILIDTDLIVKYPKTFEIGTLVRINHETDVLHNCVGIISNVNNTSDGDYFVRMLTTKDNIEIAVSPAEDLEKVEDVDAFFEEEYNKTDDEVVEP